MKISIVVPAYNEEKRIGKMLDAYNNYFENLRNNKTLDYEILVVINNTSDGTEEIVKKFPKKNKRIKYLNLPRGGKGYAVIEGFKESLKKDFDLIGFVDADLATIPEEYYKLIQGIGNYDGVIASRYIKGSIINPKPTIRRKIAKKMFNSVVRAFLFLPYRDTQCGAKIFRKDALTKVIPSIIMSQWAFDVDLLYNFKKVSYKIREVPTKWSDKEYSKINFWKAGPRMVLGVIRLRLSHSPARIFISLYDKLIQNNSLKNDEDERKKTKARQ